MSTVKGKFVRHPTYFARVCKNDLYSHTLTHIVTIYAFLRHSNLSVFYAFTLNYVWFATLFQFLIVLALFSSLVHTYIYNWPLQPFSQDYGLASHTTHVVCINFIRNWRNLQFNVDFWETNTLPTRLWRLVLSSALLYSDKENFWEIFNWHIRYIDLQYGSFTHIMLTHCK